MNKGYFLALCLFGLIATSNLTNQNEEHNLIHDLFIKKKYNSLVRPVANHSNTLHVQFSLAFQQLINIDERNQIMKSNVWLTFTWKDIQLTWDPKQYNTVSSVRVHHSYVWTPDVVLFNNADGNYEPSFMSNVVIYSTGLILWVPPAIYKSSCTIDVAFFPFDQQICEMKFGSWTYNADELDFVDVNADLNDYRISQVWDIIDYETKIKRINSGLGNHVEVIFRFVIRRKSLFYFSNLIVPCVLIALLSVTVFYLPADAGEKITLSISILFSINVFLLLVSKILPPSSTIPLISTYLLFTFILNIFTIFITVILINWNFRTPRTHRMSKWFKIIFLNYLPRLLLMERPDHIKRYENSMNRHDNCKQLDGQNLISPVLSHEMSKNKPNSVESSQFLGVDPAMERRDSTTEDALSSINFIAHHLHEQDEYDAVSEDWKYIASIFDRLQLYIFFLVTAIGSIATLMNAPYVFDFVDQKEIINEIIQRKNT